MATKLNAFLAITGLVLTGAGSAEILTYTELTNSATELAVGYPVPVPVDSLTAVSGFRTYASLHARHQDLMLSNVEVSGQVVGTTHRGRDIWAYGIGDTDNLSINEIAEAAVLINGGIHAREWASPEVVTELFEQLVERKADNGIGQYIIENVNTVLLPVNNIDGFIQTQTYPTQVTPTPPGTPIDQEPAQFDSPRDGRMRRKNMLGVDEDLTTDADRLLGVDLNRNNLQFFNNGSNSPNPESIVYRGAAPASEPEIQALNQAATLGPSDRLRLYVDAHSFSRVMFVPTPPHARQNSNTALLVNKLSNATGVDPNNPPYFPVFNQQNTGISGTAEFFAYTYNVPAWTLEIEPPQGFPGLADGGAYYGGFGISHDGFILPEAEIARARDELTTAHILALYHQAGPPSAQAVQIQDSAGTVVYAAEWQNNGDGTRTLNVTQNSPLAGSGAQYTMWLAFDKPMRWVNSANAIVNYPGQGFVGAQPVATITGTTNDSPAQQIQIPATFAAQAWPLTPGGAPSGYQRYRTDAVIGTFTVPANLQSNSLANITLDVLISDMGGLLNDGDPSTVVDFFDGGWTNYENANGVPGDAGGTDSSFSMTLSLPALPPPAPPPAATSGGGAFSLYSLYILLGLLIVQLMPLAARARLSPDSRH